MNLGICMEGLEEQFEAALRTHATGASCHYVEIGVAYCQTLAAVVKLLPSVAHTWTAIGIDPSDLAHEHFLRQDLQARWPHVRLLNVTREEAFRDWRSPITFCLIDGCHSKACVMADFLSVEPHVTQGGLIIFHDIEPDRVGSDVQPHCGVTQDVRGALQELGLLDDVRPRWKRLPDWKGDRSRGGSDCGVFEKL